MKNIKELILSSILLLTIFFVSCDEMLVEAPKALVVEEYYNTPAEVEAGLAAIYSPLRGRMSGWWIGVLESHTEWGSGMTGSANFDSFRSMQGLSAVGASRVIQFWDSFYQAIRNANLVIKNTPESTVLSQGEIDKYVAEARFMRAFTYFQLVRAWGGVPIYTEQNMDQTTGVAKSTQAQVYELITSDLEYAEIHLPDNAPLLGKPSKWAAKTVLADVYLFQERYAEASETAKEVIESDKYALEEVSVPDDFNNLFGMTANSPEEIFYLKYNVNSRSQLILFTHQINTPWFGSNGYGIYYWHDQAELYKNWDDNDLRKQHNWYEANNLSSPFLAGQPFFPNEGVTFLDSKKYNDPDATIATFDLTLYRYADILMIYAEASARANNGPTADGVEKLNMIHRRAYGLSPLAPSPVDYNMADYDLESFIDLIVREHAYEFQMEGKRWFTLKRSGRLSEAMATAGKEVAEKHLLWPIPDIEFDLNEALKPTDQNPGY
jgi:hypothetical protein